MHKTTPKPKIDGLYRSLEKGEIFTQAELREKAKLLTLDNQTLAQIMRFTIAHLEAVEGFKYQKK